MTWTWRDDDPATAASAENFNTHIENRLRALESSLLAGGGGAFSVGEEVDRSDALAAANAGDEVVPADPTKPCWVFARIANFSDTDPAGDAQIVSFETDNPVAALAELAPNTRAGAGALLAAGESYYFSLIPDVQVVINLTERSLG